MPKNKIVYSKDLDTSYILDSNGNQVGHMDGDQTNNPLAYDPNVAGIQNVSPPYTQHTIPSMVAQRGKDFVVNAASQAPMMLAPELGLPARLLASLGAGFGVDKLLNPDKTAAESGGDAMVNTLTSGLVEGAPRISVGAPPIISGNVKPSGLSKITWLRNFIPTLEMDPLGAPAKVPGLSEKLNAIPAPATRGPRGQFLKQADIDAAVAAHKAQVKDTIQSDIMDRLKNNWKGLAANTAIDNTVNAPKNARVDLSNIPQDPVPTKPVTVDITPNKEPTPLQNTPDLSPEDVQGLIRKEIEDRKSSLHPQLTPELALAVANQESKFDPKAVNKKSGATGIFQLMPAIAKSFKVDPTNPAQNVKAGITLLDQLLKEYKGDKVKALIAYNAGQKVANGIPSETSDYINKILGSKAAE